MKIEPQQMLNGLLIGFGGGFGWALAEFVLGKFHG